MCTTERRKYFSLNNITIIKNKTEGKSPDTEKRLIAWKLLRKHNDPETIHKNYCFLGFPKGGSTFDHAYSGSAGGTQCAVFVNFLV